MIKRIFVIEKAELAQNIKVVVLRLNWNLVIIYVFISVSYGPIANPILTALFDFNFH